MTTILTSRNNPLIKEIRSLGAQKRASSPDLVLAEGIRLLDEARRAQCDIRAILLTAEFGRRPIEESALERWTGDGIKILRASQALFQYVSNVISSQGALAIVRVPQLGLDDAVLPSAPLLVCACGIQDPGNLGTLIRTAFAAGASMVMTSTDTVSARNPKCIRSSAGAFFHLPVIEHIGSAALRSYCKCCAINLFRTSPTTGRIYSELDFLAPTAILLGNEGQGVAVNEWGDLPSVSIPMALGAESLNVAAAGAVLLFEAFRQRSAAKSS